MRISKILLPTFSLFVITFFIASCNHGPVFEKSLKMKNSTWDRFDIKSVEIPVNEEGQSYDITAVVHCNEQFQYDNLPFYVIFTTPSGEERMREVTVPVRDNGKMIGQPVNNLFEERLILWKNINLADKGTCKLTFENMIPKIQTEGIVDLGIVVTKAEK
jgi:gliding motility-associated lipoprotein GldH